MIDRYLLRYFLSVIDQGNFSKAAAACNVSQPTLSVGIAKLEREVGRALFHRTNRRVELTEAGVRLAAYARRIEAEFALAEQAIGGIATPNIVRLGLLATLPGSWVEAIVGRIIQAGARVELIEGRERELTERLVRGRIDMAVTLVRRTQDRFATELLFEEGYALAMSTLHPLAGRETVAAEELADNVMIVRRQCEVLAETSRHFTARGVRPFFAARTTNDERALSLVRAGLGVTVMPDGFRTEGVAMARLAGFDQKRPLGLVYAPHVEIERRTDDVVVTALRATFAALRLRD